MRHAGTTVLLLGAAVATPRAGALGQDAALGIKGGVAIANASSDQFEFTGLSGRRHPSGGVFLLLTGTERIAVQSELLYAPKSLSVRAEGGTGRASTDYMEFPILLKFFLRDASRRVRPSLLAGGFIALETRCSVSGDAVGIGPDTECEDLLAGRGRTDAGLVLGAGVDIGVEGRLFLTLDGRYSAGLVNLRWEAAGDRVNSRAWSFMAGVGVLLGS